MPQHPISLADVLYGLGFTPYDAANPAGFITAAQVAASFGFSPVQQGTGVGQLGNLVKLGWSGSKLKATVDITDLGALATESWVMANFATPADVAGASGGMDGGTF